MPSYYDYKGVPEQEPDVNRLIEFSWKTGGKSIQGWYLGVSEGSPSDAPRWKVDCGDPDGPHYMAQWAIASWAYIGHCGACERFCPPDDYLCGGCRA